MKAKINTAYGGNYVCVVLENEQGFAGKYLFSYDTCIAWIAPDGQAYLDEYKWDFSTQTGKHRNGFLSETITETRKKIADGTYKIINLN